MNIIYYLDEFPKISESFVLNEIHELVQKGHHVAVCALNNPDEDIMHEEFDQLSIPVNYIKKPSYTDIAELFSRTVVHPRVIKNVVYRTSLRQHAANMFRAKRCIEFIDSLDWHPDHFHSHFATVSKFGAQYASEYFQSPFTVTTHAWDLYGETVGESRTDLLRRSDRIITISEYNKDYIRGRLAPETPVNIIRAGIRPSKFKPTETTRPGRILTTARFVEKKGLTYALEAVDIVSERIPEVEYHIIGSGAKESALVQKIDQLGIGDKVTLLGNVSDERLIAEFDEARCFLLPCIITDSGNRDGIPVGLMEAMAMKTPSVSTNISGIPELIDHEDNGLLTEPKDVEGIAEAVTRLLQNDTEWKTYAERGRNKVITEFDIEEEADKLERVFRSCHR